MASGCESPSSPILCPVADDSIRFIVGNLMMIAKLDLVRLDWTCNHHACNDRSDDSSIREIRSGSGAARFME
jgi:hypothetical protein